MVPHGDDTPRPPATTMPKGADIIEAAENGGDGEDEDIVGVDSAAPT